MTSQYKLVEMTPEERSRYLESSIVMAHIQKKEIRNPLLRSIKDLSQIDFHAKSSILREQDEIHHERTVKTARISIRQNHIEFPRLFSYIHPESMDYEGIGGPEGLIYDHPTIDDAKHQDSVTVILTYRLKEFSWGLREYAEQEAAPRSTSNTGLQEAWFPAHVDDEGHVVYSPWILPIVECADRGTLHGNRIVPVHDWPVESFSCSVLISYAIEDIARGWYI